jgi:hypothetical protein
VTVVLSGPLVLPPYVLLHWSFTGAAQSGLFLACQQSVCVWPFMSVCVCVCVLRHARSYSSNGHSRLPASQPPTVTQQMQHRLAWGLVRGQALIWKCVFFLCVCRLTDSTSRSLPTCVGFGPICVCVTRVTLCGSGPIISLQLCHYTLLLRRLIVPHAPTEHGEVLGTCAHPACLTGPQCELSRPGCKPVQGLVPFGPHQLKHDAGERERLPGTASALAAWQCQHHKPSVLCGRTMPAAPQGHFCSRSCLCYWTRFLFALGVRACRHALLHLQRPGRLTVPHAPTEYGEVLGTCAHPCLLKAPVWVSVVSCRSCRDREHTDRLFVESISLDSALYAAATITVAWCPAGSPAYMPPSPSMHACNPHAPFAYVTCISSVLRFVHISSWTFLGAMPLCLF